MKLTREQKAIIQSSGDIKINAVAGSGKTTTLIEYARSRPAGARILYLAFNKSVKLQAIRKFAEEGLDNVKVETAHSLAYKYVVFRHNFKVRMQGFKTHEIVDLLGLRGNGEKHAEFIIANHINKFITYFCNSDQAKVQDLNYLDVVSDKKAIEFVKAFYSSIENGVRHMLNKMNKGEIEVLHDFYLKKFQLMNPQLPYDYILFDEAQDASPAMLDIFLKQKAVKVMVGDTHQQIYGWRYAVNSLEKARFKSFKLSTSFRFGTNIAHLAKEILQWKKHTAGALDVAIAGFGVNKKHRSKATIARTNLGLLLKAIEYITEHEDVKHIYFEGNINSYTYADEGTSLYDVLSLYNDKRSMIKDKLVGAMNNLEELEEYIEKTEDVQLGMMVEIVREYGNEIPGILKSLREKHTGDEEKQKAEMIFSTVHRCKGMEYDDIELVNDFITESRLERLAADPKERETMNLARLNEEINLLYVAVTRTKSTIHIPETLLPKDFPVAPDIQVVKVKKENKESKEKAYTFEKKRESYKEAYQPWTAELDMELEEMHAKGFDVFELAEYFQRANSAIMSRLRKLGLI